jgi:hypothetical protein
MVDWEHLAQRKIAEIERALPEPIRARATEVPVFFLRAGDRKGDACLGVFEGYSILDGAPTQPDQIPRITLFFDILAQAAKTERAYLSARFGLHTCMNWNTTSAGMKDRSPMSA